MTWTFIWMMLVLKIPVVGMLWLVWWAIRQEPEQAETADDDGGIQPDPDRRPRWPRSRGPHGEPSLPAPPRVRVRPAQRVATLQRDE